MNLKNFFRRVAVAAVAGALAFAPISSVVHATGYSPVAGGTVSFVKYLKHMSTSTPNAVFSYSISGSGTGHNAGSGVEKVYAGYESGLVTGTATIGTATFAAGDTNYQTTTTAYPADTGSVVASGTTDANTVTLDTDQRYSRALVQIDLSGVTYNEPGIYRYEISETGVKASSDAGAADLVGTMPLDSRKLYLDVYVIDNAGALQVNSKVLHYAGTDTGQTTASTKAVGLISTYTGHDFTLTMAVAGNQGSMDEYFPVTFTINGLNQSYAVTGTFDTTTATTPFDSTTHSNPEAISSSETTYYLKTGQSLTIKDLPVNATVTVAQDSTKLANEGYTSAYVLDAGSSTTGSSVSAQTMSADHSVAFTNTKQGSVPTGVIMSVIPGVAIIMLGLGGYFILSRRNKEMN